MGFSVVPPATTGRRGLPDNRVRLDPKAGRIVLTRRLAASARLTGYVLVLWDPDARCLALKPAGSDDPNAVKVNAGGKTTVYVAHRRAVQLTGVEERREIPAAEKAGMLTFDVGSKGR